MPGKLWTSTAKQASEFNKLPAPQSIMHTLVLFSKENKLLQSSNLANRLKSYWRKEFFSKITKNNIISTILLISQAAEMSPKSASTLSLLGWPLLLPFFAWLQMAVQATVPVNQEHT